MNDGNFERDSNAEHQPTLQLINELLPRYYEVYGENPRYEIERSMIIDGHEVAWLKFEGQIEHDILEKGREGQLFSGHEVYCACKFTEGVGWRLTDNGRPVGLSSGEACPQKNEALRLRYSELREEYQSRDMLNLSGQPSSEELQALILDLIEKAKSEEFIGPTSGAHFWGGYFYLQTVANIAAVDMGDLWKVADNMMRDKKIQLEGAVVQPYVEPTPPSWEPYRSLEREGYKVVALLPTHSKMPQIWQFELYKKTGEDEELTNIDIDITPEPIVHPPLFGVDVDDAHQAELRMIEIIEAAIEQGR